MKAVLTVGISASGKSTVGKEMAREMGGDTRIIERDMIRADIFVNEKQKPFTWREWNFKWEKEVTEKVTENLRAYSDLGANVIISDTNLDKNRRDALINELQNLGYTDVEVIYVDTSLEECLVRDKERANGVGESVIFKQYMQIHDDPDYFDNTIEEKVALSNDSLEDCVIFDIDGTLAHMNGRSPFHYDKVDTDLVDEEVASLLFNYYESGVRVIIFSGRDGCCRRDTQNWLSDNDIYYDEFYMRPAGDTSKDYDVKEKMLRDNVLGKYRVRLVVDDRPQVVKRWIGRFGIKTFTVGNPWIDF